MPLLHSLFLRHDRGFIPRADGAVFTHVPGAAGETLDFRKYTYTSRWNLTLDEYWTCWICCDLLTVIMNNYTSIITWAVTIIVIIQLWELNEGVCWMLRWKNIVSFKGWSAETYECMRITHIKSEDNVDHILNAFTAGHQQCWHDQFVPTDPHFLSKPPHAHWHSSLSFDPDVTTLTPLL